MSFVPVTSPVPELSRKVVAASMAGVLAAILMAALDVTIVETAMPRAIAEMNGFEHYTAVITMYLLTATAMVPIVGKLSDVYGRRLFLLSGVAIFVLGSAMCGAAQSMIQLVVFRGFQGIGAGFSQAMAFTTIADLFPPSRRGRVMGLMSAMYGLATVIGPAVGGVLTDGPGWRWCFYVNLPVGIAAFTILWIAFPRVTVRTANRSIDWLGAVTFVAGVVPLLLALSWGGRDYAWESPVIVGLLAAGLVVLGLFAVIERRAPEPILPFGLFRNRLIWTSAAATMTVSMAMYCTILFIPLFLQVLVGRSATTSGAVLTPLMLSIVIASLVSGQVLSHVGRYRTMCVAGAVVSTVGLLLVARMTPSTSASIVLRNMVIIGLGLGVTLPVFPVIAQNAVDMPMVGVVTSTIQFLRSMGGALGAAVFGAVLTNRYGADLARAMAAGAANGLPPEVVSTLQNPQAFMNPRVVAQLRALGPDAVARLAPFMAAVRGALAVSLQTVFLCGAIASAITVGLCLLLTDVPLRTSNQAAPVQPATRDLREVSGVSV